MERGEGISNQESTVRKITIRTIINNYPVTINCLNANSPTSNINTIRGHCALNIARGGENGKR